jgi:F-type H+-transporting ATPase subunit gamma
MPTLIDLRRRIKSVKNTQQVTKAMKTVSTAKFKKAQRVIIERRPHWHGAPALIWDAARWTNGRGHPLLTPRQERRVHVIVLTSDKGLCGAFNSNLLNRVQEFLDEKSKRAGVRLIVIGRKAVHYFRKQAFPIDRAVGEKTDRLDEDVLGSIARQMIRMFLFQETDAVYLAFNEFKSVLAPRINIKRLIPVVPPEQTRHYAQPGGIVVPAWEPGARDVLDSLLPLFIRDQIAHAYYESQTAEQAARMMAMDSASRNAGELIHKYFLVMNKIRQAGITKELLEIMTAVEALKK